MSVVIAVALDPGPPTDLEAAVLGAIGPFSLDHWLPYARPAWKGPKLVVRVCTHPDGCPAGFGFVKAIIAAGADDYRGEATCRAHATPALWAAIDGSAR